MARATDVKGLQTQVDALIAAVQQLIVFIGDYPPQDDWHAAKKQAIADAKATTASVQ